MKDICIPPLVTGAALRKYFLKHVGERTLSDDGFYTVVKPLHVFKKADAVQSFTPTRIVNLIIPVGATVYAPSSVFNPVDRDGSLNCDDRKMRASEAYVHSIAKFKVRFDRYEDLPHEMRWGAKGMPCSFKPKRVSLARNAVSSYDCGFKYTAGKTVKPTHNFDRHAGQCASGIHFFLNLRDALQYN